MAKEDKLEDPADKKRRKTIEQNLDTYEAALEDLVNVNSLFTLAVFVGVAFAAPGQRSLENPECDPGPTMAKNLLVCEVVSFSCFLLSSLVAKSLKLDLKVNREKNFTEDDFALQVSRRVLLYVSGLATVVGCTLLMASMICLVQIRLGKIGCKSLYTETATYCMVGIVAVALLIYIILGGWAMHQTFATLVRAAKSPPKSTNFAQSNIGTGYG